jgi:Uma2 family endonuclease
MVPPPAEPHNRAIARLNRKLAAYLENNPGLGELYIPRAAIWTEYGTYLEPDLMFVAREHLPVAGEPIRTADFVIEGLSRETALYDKQTKADTYAALGVRELWLADPFRHHIEQRILEAGIWRVLTVARPGDTLRSHVLPGFTVNVAEIFEGLPRD